MRWGLGLGVGIPFWYRDLKFAVAVALLQVGIHILWFYAESNVSGHGKTSIWKEKKYSVASSTVISVRVYVCLGSL